MQLTLLTSCFAQDCFSFYSSLKQNPSDNLALTEVLENCSKEGVIEELILLKSYIAHNIPSAIKQSILILINYDIGEDYLNSIIPDSVEINLESDTLFSKKLNLSREAKRSYLEIDTVSKIVEECYTLDQSVRSFEKLTRTKGGIRMVDSLVMKQILTLLEADKISTMKLGIKNEEKLYICLLHEMRYVNDIDFAMWDSLLINLVNSRKFNPYYYANIVDERLRIKKSPEYPRYNFLRSIKVSNEREADIIVNRRKINAY